jgi:hypothetical protein
VYKFLRGWNFGGRGKSKKSPEFLGPRDPCHGSLKTISLESPPGRKKNLLKIEKKRFFSR